MEETISSGQHVLTWGCDNLGCRELFLVEPGQSVERKWQRRALAITVPQDHRCGNLVDFVTMLDSLPKVLTLEKLLEEISKETPYVGVGDDEE